MIRLWRRPTLVLQLSTALLCFLGWVLIFSSSGVVAEEQLGDAFYFLKKQAMWSVLGLAGMVVAYFIPYDLLRRYARWVGLGCILLLLTVYIPGLGVEKNGARRWIKILHFGGLQPSEFVKVGVILYLAKYLSERQQRLREFKRGLLPPLICISLVCVLILLEPDFGTAVLLGTVGVIMLYMGGVRLAHLATMSISMLPLIYLLAWGAEYRRRRLLVFLRPWDDPMGDGFHIVQSLVALGSGGWQGVGIGGSMQKLYFLPYPYSDFIFAIIGEEGGLVGCAIILCLYAALIVSGFAIAGRCPDLFGKLLVSGIITMIGLQTFVHAGVVTGLLPTKGLPLPLISFGGSSMVATLIGLGLVLNVARLEKIAKGRSIARSRE